MKKTIKILLFAIIVVSALSLTSCFSNSESKGLVFELNDDKSSYSVVGLGGCKNSNIVIPNEYKGLPVTKIGEYAFSTQKITGVKLSDNIEEIGDYAFSNCPKLKTIKFSESGKLKTIGDYAFYWPSFWLWDLYIPEGVEEIGQHAFDLAWPINVSLPNSLMSVGEGAFVGMNGAEGSHEAYYFDFMTPYNVYDNAIYLGNKTNPELLLCSIHNTEAYNCSISEKTKIIATRAFLGSNNLKKITVPASVKNIGFIAFALCTSLESINVDENNTEFKSIDGNLYSKDGKYLLQYAIGKQDSTFFVPDTVKIIESYAFYKVQNLNAVFIPNSVKVVGSYVFSSSSSDLYIFCEAESQPADWLEDWNFYDCPVVWGYNPE